MTVTTVRTRPILFTGAMVRALLAGTKTQTRRIVKPQPPSDCTGAEYSDRAADWMFTGPSKSVGSCSVGPAILMQCPYGIVGHRLWVRETVAIEGWPREFGDEPPLPKDRPWKHRPAAHADDEDRWSWPHYRATDPAPDLSCERDSCRACESGDPSPHWTPSIHMPRWASRITLEVTEIRVQRLQVIGPEDAIAEGLSHDDNWWHGAAHPVKGTPKVYNNPCHAYRDLWESINGKGSWDANPWVWAISFRRVTA